VDIMLKRREKISPTTTMEAPAALPTEMGRFAAVDIASDGDDHPSWRRPVRAHFRGRTDGGKLVGLDRLPEGPATLVASRR
jgi:hypothetical protein